MDCLNCMKKMFHFDQSSPLLIHLIVTDCYFSHNEQYYKIVVFQWVVPSLLLLPTYSWNILRNNYYSNTCIYEWLRFVDDVFAIIPENINVTELNIILNSYNPSISSNMKFKKVIVYHF